MLALAIPILDNWDFTEKCIKAAVGNSRHPFELVIIDNGLGKDYRADIKKLLKPNVLFMYVRNRENLGVIYSFKQGIEYARSDIICFIHNDVLLHEPQWEKKIEHYFDDDPKLGLAGLLGGNIVHPNGGRQNVVSKLLGKEWGSCECHDPVALHHGNLLEKGPSPAIVLDGIGMFFRRTCGLQLIRETNALDYKFRPLHHAYDRAITLQVVALGWHVAVLDIAADHWNGATANQSDKYGEAARKWFEMHPEHKQILEGKSYDQATYDVAMQQFFDQWASKLPASVNDKYEVTWSS